MLVNVNNLIIPLRRLLRTPSFSILTVLTLGLGLGAVTTAFTLVQTILLRPLPYRDPASLVRVLALNRQEGQLEWLSWAEAQGLDEHKRSLQDVATSTVFPATLRTDQGNERLQRGFVSFNYFALLGVDPVAGSLFLEGDRQQALISHRLWQQRWHSRGDAVGQKIDLDGRLYTIVGVLPEAVYTHDLGSIEADLWLPESLQQTPSDPHFRIYTAIARLRPGAASDQARQELEALQARLAKDEPQIYQGWGAHVDPLRESVVGETERGLLLLFGAVCLILLIVSINLANLMMTRFVGRRREIATRLALGGNSREVLGDAALEGGMLAAAGGVLGTVLAVGSIRLLPGLLPFALPRQTELAADFRMLGIALAGAALATLLFALLPAAGALRTDLSVALREAGRGASARGGRLQRLVIAAQVALSLPLLIGAALLTQSLLELQGRELGMQPDGLLTVRVSVPPAQYPDASSRIRFFEQLLDDLRALPGVEGVGATLQVPFLAHQADRARFRFLEAEEKVAEERPRALLQVVSQGYFESLGTRLVEGRLFDSRDSDASTPVMIISRALQRREMPERSPIGLRIETDITMTPGEPKVRQVIGVVEDIPHFGPRTEPEPQIFVPHSQSAWHSMGLMLRSRLTLEQIVSQTRTAALNLEPNAVLDDVTPLRLALDTTLGQPRFYSRLLLFFALTATLLSCLGLYGLLSYSVASRTQELGIRAAIGATPLSLLGLIVRNGLSLTLTGLAIGLLLASAGVRLLQSMLYGVAPFDPWTFAGAAVLSLLFAAIAALIPARRAAALDPVEALRSGE